MSKTLPCRTEFDAVEAERAERALDRLTLRVEDAVLQRYENARLHAAESPAKRRYFTSTGPVFGTRSFSFNTPSRRATSW